MVLLTSTRQTKCKIIISLLSSSANNMLHGAGSPGSPICVCVVAKLA